MLQDNNNNNNNNKDERAYMAVVNVSEKLKDLTLNSPHLNKIISDVSSC